MGYSVAKKGTCQVHNPRGCAKAHLLCLRLQWDILNVREGLGPRNFLTIPEKVDIGKNESIMPSE